MIIIVEQKFKTLNAPQRIGQILNQIQRVVTWVLAGCLLDNGHVESSNDIEVNSTKRGYAWFFLSPPKIPLAYGSSFIDDCILHAIIKGHNLSSAL